MTSRKSLDFILVEHAVQNEQVKKYSTYSNCIFMLGIAYTVVKTVFKWLAKQLTHSLTRAAAAEP